MRARIALGLLVGFAVGLLLIPPPALAGTYQACGTGTRPACIGPTPGSGIAGPAVHPGKEYSDNPDKNAANAADPEQNIRWDGLGGVTDTFDYSGSRLFATGGEDEDRQVDALANLGDALYTSVTNNNAPLLFSVSGDANIYYERTAGGFGTWATQPQIDQHGVKDVDGLEVWGGDTFDDANRYSLYGDPDIDGAAGAQYVRTSVWAYNSGAHQSTPYITAAQIAAAIGRTDLEDEIDLDAMMVFGGPTFDDTNDSIMFSIAPIPGLFDGGEIWVWTLPNPLAVFLNHGGHLWNTAFPVAATFGLGSENINALEAAATPEPATFLLLGTGLAGLGFVRRRRRAA